MVGALVGIAGVAFIVRTLVTRWDEVRAALANVNVAVLLGSLALGLCAMTLIGWLWTSMIRTRGHDTHHRALALSWYFTGQLGKYVPGGIWPIVGRAEMAARSGVPRTDAYASTGLSLVTTYLGATITVAAGSLVSGERRGVGILVVAGLAVGYVLFANGALRARVLSLVGRFGPGVQSLTDPRRLARLAVAHVPAWILMSLSTSVTATAFGAHFGIFQMMFVTSSSWLVGFVVVGVPGGIGVREAVFTSLASGIVTAPVAVSLALVSRVVFIAVDVIGALAAHLAARATARRLPPVSGSRTTGRAESPDVDR